MGEGGGGIKLIKLSEFEQRDNKTHGCIVVHRMARHNHLIDLYYLLSLFEKLMVIKSLKRFT